MNIPKKRNVAISAVFVILIMIYLLNVCKYAMDHRFGHLDTLAIGKTDKSSVHHGYTEIYEEIFLPLQNEAIKICEIGIAEGGSLNLWERYFPRASIYGIDIVDYSEDFKNSKRIKTFTADQADREQLQSFIDTFGDGYDILIDDGGHSMNMQQISIGFLFKYVKPGGYYIIEDVHTSLPAYYPNYGVDKGEGNTTLKMIIGFIRSGRIESEYLTAKEAEYMGSNIEYCKLFYRHNQPHTIACIFKKRKMPIIQKGQ